MPTSPAYRASIPVAFVFFILGVTTCGQGNEPTLAINISTSEVPLSASQGGTAELATVGVTPATGALSGLTASVSFTDNPPKPWLEASLDDASATLDDPALLTLRIIDSDLPAATYKAVVKVSSPTAANEPRINVSFAVKDASPTRLIVSTQPPSSVLSGQLFAQPPVVQLANAAGDAVALAGAEVTVALQGEPALRGTATANTDASGRATFGDLSILGTAGARTLLFESGDLAQVESAAINVAAGAATAIAAASAPTQQGAVGTKVTEPPAVIVTDEAGNPVPGVEVTFQAEGGTVDPTAPVPTGPDGIARLSSWTLSATAGSDTVTGSVTDLQGSPVEFTANGGAGEGFSIEKSSGDNLTGVVNTTLGTPHVVVIKDQSGNPVQNVTVSWSAGGGGDVSAPTSTTDQLGAAEITRTLGPTSGPQTTTATATLSGGPASVTFSIDATTDGPSAMARCAANSGGNAQTGQVGTALAEALCVRVTDKSGNTVQGVTVTWNGSGSLQPRPTSPTGPTGEASIQWTLGTTAGTQTASASAAGTPVSFSATATPGPANGSNSTLVLSRGSFPAGGAGISVTVTAKDVNNNPIGGAAVALRYDGTGGNFVNPNPITATSDPNLGQASTSFSSTMAETKTISAVINSTATVTKPVTVDPGAPNVDRSSVEVTPSDFAVGSGSALITVTLRDANNNLVPGQSVRPTATGLNSFTPAAPTGLDGRTTSSMSSTERGQKTIAVEVPSLDDLIQQMPLVTAFFSYDASIWPIVSNRCVSCHTNPVPPKPDLSSQKESYTILVNGLPGGPMNRYLTPGDPTVGSLVNRVITGTMGMLSQAQKDSITAWITDGAKP